MIHDYNPNAVEWAQHFQATDRGVELCQEDFNDPAFDPDVYILTR